MSLQLPSIPNPQIQGVNWKAVLFWGILLGLAACAVYIYVGQPDILAFVKNLPSLNFNSLIQQLTLDNILNFIKTYGALFSIATAGFTFAYGIYQKHQANKAAQQLLLTQAQANTEVNTAYNTASAYQTQAEQYKANASAYQQQAEQYKAKYESLANSGASDALAESQSLVAQQQQAMRNMQSTIDYQTRLIEDLKVKTVEKTVVK